jgi:predicted phosphodiesterase
MKILHIGDFHYKGKIVFEQEQILKALKSSLQEKPPVDFIFFSGDLVNNGSVKRYFDEAKEYLLSPVQQICQTPSENLFICQGNHDVNREKIINAIINSFSEKNTLDSEELGTWYDKNKADVSASFGPSEHFYEFVKKHFLFNAKDAFQPLFSIHIRTLHGKNIGVVTLNSSWFSAGSRLDRGQLIYHIQLLKDAISKVRNCDLKIIMQHHPLSYFKEPIAFELQDLIFSNFNILLNGHLHKESVEIQFKCNNGIYINTTKATLCYDKGDIGYNIIEVDLNDLSKLLVERTHYINSENKFVSLDKVEISLPASEEKVKQNRLRNKILAKYNHEIEDANKLLLDYNENQKRSFLEKFTDPVLSKDSDEQSSIGENVKKIPLEDIRTLKINYLIFGKDKCGKTSLLKKLLLEFLHDYPNRQIIPIYIDYKQIESQDNNFNIVKRISNYYGIGHRDAEAIISNGKLLLLIDNLDTSSSLHATIVKSLSDNPSIRFIICSEYLTSRIFAEDLDDLSYDKIFFKSLSRTEIRQYTNKNPEIKDDDKDLVIERVTKFCSQLQLPMNYWTVSL